MTGRGVLDCAFLVQGFTGFLGPSPGMTGPHALQGATIDSYLHPDWISHVRLRHLMIQGHCKSDTPSLGAKKSTQSFFVQSFPRTLRVMDVRAENRGRPHQKVRLSAAPVVGRNFLTQGRPGVRVRNVCGKSGPKSLCLCCVFFFPES